MEFIQHIERVISRFDPPPIYSPSIQAQRQALRAEIEQDQARLELLRVKEIELRAALVGELRHLKFNVETAAHRIETRQWADGCAALDTDFEHVLEAQEALMDCIDDIKHTESMIEDAENTLDDSGCWNEEND